MLALTHKIIAGQVCEAISNELNIDIDLNSLKKGSIAPDKYPKKFFMGHSLDVSYAYVKDRIDDLCNGEFPESKKAMESFSFKLGVIIHFISDYFCQAHNDKEFKNIVRHLLYERNLKKYFSRRVSTFKVRFSSKRNGWSKKESIVNCINKKLKEYNSLRRTMTNDLVYSVSVSMMVALKIVSVCMENSSIRLIEGIA